LLTVFVHNVLFKWKPGTTPAQIDEITAALGTLPGRVPSIRSYTIGSDLGLSQPEVSWDFSIVAQFDDEAGWRDYVSHPDHEAVRDQIVAPHIAARATAQFTVK